MIRQVIQKISDQFVYYTKFSEAQKDFPMKKACFLKLRSSSLLQTIFWNCEEQWFASHQTALGSHVESGGRERQAMRRNNRSKESLGGRRLFFLSFYFLSLFCASKFELPYRPRNKDTKPNLKKRT